MGGSLMGNLLQDVRYAVRTLAKNPAFATVAVLTLAIGIGANTAIFSVANGVLLNPLPFPDPGQLTFIWSDLPKANYIRGPISGPELIDLRERSRLYQGFGSIWATSGALVEGGRPEPVRVGLVTSNFLSLLGTEPELGRLFLPEEEGSTAPQAIVLSGGLWQRRFGGDRKIIGRSIRVDGGWGFEGGTYTVVGVMPASFKIILPPDASVPDDLDAWIPFHLDLNAGPRGSYYLRTIGRVASGVSLDQARSEIVSIGRRIQSEFPDYSTSGRSFYALPLHQDVVRQVRPAVLALLGGVSFVLLIACVNVANLLLARATSRSKEISVRVALGASRGRIALQLLTESLVLSFLGGAVGVLAGWWGLDLLLALQPGSLPQGDSVGINLPVLAFALVVSVFSGVFFGMVPVMESFRMDLATVLRTGGRRTNGNTGQLTRNLLVVSEVALGFILLIGAGLMISTFVRLQNVDAGFRPGNVLTFQLSLPAARYPTQNDMANFSREIERRLATLPGVEAVGAINQLPLADLPNWSTPYLYEEVRDEPRGNYEADARVVTPGYFPAIGAQLIAGRFFTELDNEQNRNVAIVDELLARRAWPEGGTIGQQLNVELWDGDSFVPTWAEVVGVVKHIRHHTLSNEVREQVYMPFAQGPRNQMGFAVRTAANPSSLAGPVRNQIAGVDKELAVSDFRYLDQYVSGAIAGPRFTMILAGIFAAFALLLATVGIYGVISYSVGRRTQEIGLRMALGAQPSDILKMVARQGVLLIALGLAFGFLGALGITRSLEGLLFGVTPTDPATFAAVSALLVAVALFACYLPARRATRVDPIVALRYE